MYQFNLFLRVYNTVTHNHSFLCPANSTLLYCISYLYVQFILTIHYYTALYYMCTVLHVPITLYSLLVNTLQYITIYTYYFSMLCVPTINYTLYPLIVNTLHTLICLNSDTLLRPWVVGTDLSCLID